MHFPELAQERGRADDVADGPELDEEYLLRLRVILRAVPPLLIYAVDAGLFVGLAGNMSSEPATVILERLG